VDGRGRTWQPRRSPRSLAGANTQALNVELTGDIDAHCERARKAGATIIAEPEDQFYGDRTYRARDPEGHVWSFSMHVRDVTREEAERMTGLKIIGWTSEAKESSRLSTASKIAASRRHTT
jgi:hypothetical protein